MDRTQGPEPRRSAARGSYAVGDERRARILDVAVEHFAQWGFHASSLARIAKDVGITQGGLLHHFRSKEDLLVSVLRHSDEQDAARFFAREPRSAVEAFDALVDLAAHNAARPGRTRMFNVLAAEAGERGHPAHGYFLRRYDTVIGKITKSLRAAVDRGELERGTDCEGIAAEIAAVMDGLQLQWALAPGSYDMAGRLRTYLDRLLRVATVDGSGLPARV
ncbi:TetR/AcrR family transcriptional regulator [Streptomyces sp. NPDC056296]|uniref:TetR/AcrR family transcriptional regulator n=1 Tax=Streptomyces sp. NPDC056296 TaxID=3345775 RepID=UPI0035D8E49A